MDPLTVAETFRQIASGTDFTAPASLFKGVSDENASRRLPGHPYSIAEVLWHAVFWQDNWLARLQGGNTRSFMDDWQTPAPGEFKSLVARFLKNEATALKIAGKRKFSHSMSSDEAAIQKLIGMAIHDSYHLGQINLLKRALRLAKTKSTKRSLA